MTQEVERLRDALMRIQRLDLADLRRAGEVEDIGYQAQEIANAALATSREEPAEAATESVRTTSDQLSTAREELIADVFGRGNEPDPMFTRKLDALVDSLTAERDEARRLLGLRNLDCDALVLDLNRANALRHTAEAERDELLNKAERRKRTLAALMRTDDPDSLLVGSVWAFDDALADLTAAEAEVKRLRGVIDSERSEKNRLRVIIADLDRCEHGRHEPDVCDGCGGKSHGNPLADVNVGYNLDGKPWTPRAMRAALATPPSEGRAS